LFVQLVHAFLEKREDGFRECQREVLEVPIVERQHACRGIGFQSRATPSVGARAQVEDEVIRRLQSADTVTPAFPSASRQSKKVRDRDSASGKDRISVYRDLLSASLAWYSATVRCNSRRTKLERLRSCLAASPSIASRISLGTLLIVSS